MGGKRRIELVGKLNEKSGEVHGRELELDVREAVARDVKELVHQTLESACLIERNLRVASTLRFRHIAHLVQEREVADNRGERRLEVVSKIGHKVSPTRGLVCELALPLCGGTLGVRGNERELLPTGRKRLMDL